MGTKNYTYSIIIPHKNTPVLLQRCLDSIPHRDDLHIIVVDDNSDSDKVDFEQFPGYDRDDVELIFTKEGKGAGYARNVGLAHADCEMVLFADADDFFNYCLSEVLDEYKDKSYDISFFNASSLDSDNYTNTNRANYLNSIINLYDNNPQEAILYLKYDCGYPWAKIIRKDIIDNHQITFDEIIIQNDTKFSYLVGHYANNIKVDHRAIYCITYQPSSITYTLTDEKYLTRMHVIGKRGQFLRGHHVELPSFRKYTLRNLVEIKELGKDELYKKSIDVLKMYDIDPISIDKEVAKILKRKRKDNTRRKINLTIKRIFK